jgi:hypothetical protein
LAVQKSPYNPPAAWLWQDFEKVLGEELKVRVGGSFVWPPKGVDLSEIKNVVFVAGGVGIKYALLAPMHALHDENSNGLVY